MDTENKLKEMRELELKLFVIEFNKASLLDRSFSKRNLSSEKKKEFRENLLDFSIYLMNKIDDNTLINSDIREKIQKLKAIDGNISFGQAQKVINVVLKLYCFLTNKLSLIEELDCPLDSTTMKGYKIPNAQMINVTEEDYLIYQKKFDSEYNGIRILKDAIYDENRINNFLTIKY
ncbi:MAG: hypothetical protein FWC47_17660 [Oscillospiraceae bacterium]|nr:hypothetical protein [Oscillospiraceae bacterium]